MNKLKQKRIRFVSRPEDAFISGLWFLAQVAFCAVCVYVIVVVVLAVFAGY